MTDATEDPALIEYVLKYSVKGGVQNQREVFDNKWDATKSFFFTCEHYSLEYIRLYECTSKEITPRFS